MSKLRQHGLTMIEVALAVMISTLVMTAVWLQLQDMIKFYLSRNTAYTINARFDHVMISNHPVLSLQAQLLVTKINKSAKLR